MNAQEQKIAIAEACGWKKEGRFKDRERWISPDFKKVCTVWKDGQLGGELFPDYLNDLNAMHEAEKVFSPQRCVAGVYSSANWERYYATLCRNAERDGTSVAHATAPQRAEAFLRTLGLWKESK